MTPSLVVIGCSAGGIETLKKLLPAIPLGVPSAFAIVLHSAQDSKIDFSELFLGQSQLPVKEAEDKERIKPGMIYFSPAGYHLLIEANLSFSLSSEEPVLFSRPSIDVLFESAAVALKEKVLAIVLSGANSDGAVGTKEVLECGGTALVEDPKSARYSAMPQAAIELNSKSKNLHVLKLEEMKPWLLDYFQRDGH